MNHEVLYMFYMQKMMTAVRGATRESAERVVDANAIRIFEQEIYECECAMGQAKHDLARVMAEKMRLERGIARRARYLAEKETQAGQALEKGLEELAHDLATVIADQEKTLADERKASEKLGEHERKLRLSLQSAAQSIQNYRRELRMVQATQSTQQATASLAVRANSMGSRISDMQDSLQRIRDRQERFDDMKRAMEQLDEGLNDDGLEDKLRKAGIGPRTEADAVLDRIRKKSA